MPQHSVVFLDVSYDGKSVGRLVFELFDELLPRTCHNFRQLCGGRSGVSDRTGTVLWYAGTPVHRIVRGGWLQAGGTCLITAALAGPDGCECGCGVRKRKGQADSGRRALCMVAVVSLRRLWCPVSEAV